MASRSGKSITTSVPSISIKFHANAEHIEELYGSDDEQKSETSDKKLSAAIKEKGSNSTGNIQDTTEITPHLRLNRRSNSTEVSNVSSSPPSDTWKFLSEITGKIGKRFEDTITEIKTRNQEDGSPSKKAESKTEKNSKDNSSLSDSEELSESSLSRTCGLVSTTTEGAEMSSDDETSSLKNDTPTNLKLPQSPALPVTPTLRQRFRLLKASKNGSTVFKEGTVSMSNLTKLYNVTVDGTERPLQAHHYSGSEVESAVEALDEHHSKTDSSSSKTTLVQVSDAKIVLSSLEKSVDNIEIDKDGTVVFKEVEGFRWRGDEVVEGKSEVRTVFGQKGFVDFRYGIHKTQRSYLFPILVIVLSIFYLLIQRYSIYLAGMIAGICISSFSYYLMNKIAPYSSISSKDTKTAAQKPPKNIWEIPAAKEYQPTFFEGWVNEYPDPYDPSTYHISLTQPVYLRLQDNFLRMSYSFTKVQKRATWNEGEIKKNFTHQRIYNLLGAKVCLLPHGLAKIRHWSKKYPICIVIPNDQLKFSEEIVVPKELQEEREHSPPSVKNIGFSFRKKVSTASSPQLFSKLCAEQDNFYTDAEVSRSDTSSPVQEDVKFLESSEKSAEPNEEIDSQSNLDDSWSNCTLDESPTDVKIYIFGRTDREKEDWFRRLTMATRPFVLGSQDNGGDLTKAANTESILKESEYGYYMSSIIKAFKKKEEELSNKPLAEIIEISNASWINAFLGRILFDCMCDEIFTLKVKERIHRKLAAIRLPYFIEELSITELNLGKKSPLFRKINKPTIDDRGLWIDMSMTYEGMVVLTLMTKLNLMRLKQPPTDKEVQNRSAIFHSDVDDSAESSSDDESVIFPGIPEPSYNNSSGPTPPVNKSKKLMKMVDKITESKFFQAATENKFIKRAMEGVSNTDLRLKVEVRALEGTLVLNIPPPPSDRLWVGFRPVPELSLSAHPIVGERNITFMHVTSWIEKKLIQEFQKLLVIPNMEDLIIPIMMSKLPE